MELSPRSPIIKKFLELAGGEQGIITILPTASELGAEVGETYKKFFSKYCHDVEFYLIEERVDTEDEVILERIKKSTAIFFTGGNQLRITSLLGGSPVMSVIRESLNRNIIIAGTSAGAAAMSDPMIAGGKADRITKGQLKLASGLGFMQKMVIDSHFIKRGRMSRLFHVVSENPGTLGIGLSEDTGFLHELNTEYFEVIGTRNVIVVDGRHIKHTNIVRMQEDMPYSTTNIVVHALGPHYKYNFHTFEVIIPDEKLIYNVAKTGEVAEIPYIAENSS